MVRALGEGPGPEQPREVVLWWGLRMPSKASPVQVGVG